MASWVIVSLLWTASLAAEPGAPSAVPDEPTAEVVAPALDPRAVEFEASLTKQTGRVDIGGGLAHFDTGEHYSFLGAEDAQRLLQAWGNPPTPSVLGAIVPAGVSVFSDETWAVIVEYEEDGWVSDADADAIDYGALLAEMQEQTRVDSQQRVADGFGTVALIGWAEPPRYDKEGHKLYWAKELAFGESEGHTLNYGIRVLGRRGVLVMNAIAGMEQLAQIRPKMEAVMAATTFQEGHRYTDFDPDVDQVAAYGLGALVAGGVAAKAGLFKGLIALLIAGKKAIVLGAVALFGIVRSVFGRGSQETEPKP